MLYEAFDKTMGVKRPVNQQNIFLYDVDRKVLAEVLPQSAAAAAALRRSCKLAASKLQQAACSSDNEWLQMASFASAT